MYTYSIKKQTLDKLFWINLKRKLKTSLSKKFNAGIDYYARWVRPTPYYDKSY